MPRVSVITVVKDHHSGLDNTHKSLLKQEFTDWEMIIVDGHSKDGTLAMARALELNDSRIRVQEQESTGIYGAMNEGINLANGKFSWFMNAGDKFDSSSSLGHAVAEIVDGSVGVVIGGYQIENRHREKIYQFPSKDLTQLGFAFNRRGGCHQAMIFQTKVLVEVGGFDTSYSLASDFDLVLKVIKKSSGRRVSEVLATIEPGGRADQGIFLVHQQKHLIRGSLLGGTPVRIASFLWTFLARSKIISRGLINKINIRHTK